MTIAPYVIASVIADLLAYPLSVVQKGSPLIEAIDAMLESAFEGECVALAQDTVYNSDDRYLKANTIELLYLIKYHDDHMGLSLSHDLRHKILARALTEISYQYNTPGASHIVAHFVTASELQAKIKSVKYFGVAQYIWEDVSDWLKRDTGVKHVEVMDYYAKRHGVFDVGIELTAMYKFLLHTGRLSPRTPPEPPKPPSTLPGWAYVGEDDPK